VRTTRPTEAVDHVQRNTADDINARINRETEARVSSYESRSREEITRRIEELDREWDIERWLETNASTLALTGLTLGVVYSKKWLIVPGIVLPFLLQHAVQGWCPPLPLMRRFGIRTSEEIEREKYALKVLRGDFSNVVEGGGEGNRLRAAQALAAVNA
jgi:hypothetical protein